MAASILPKATPLWEELNWFPSSSVSPYLGYTTAFFLAVVLAYSLTTSTSDVKKLPSINPVGLFGSVTQAKVSEALHTWWIIAVDGS